MKKIFFLIFLLSIYASAKTQQLDITVSTVDVLCFGESNGEATANVSGGMSPFLYYWSNGNTTETIIGLSAGTYALTVVDALSSSSTTVFEISQPNEVATSIFLENVLCYGESTGWIDLVAFGGSGTYTYHWNNAATSQDLFNIAAGTYVVTVTDSNDCVNVATAEVTQPMAPLSGAVTGFDVTCYGGNDGSIDLNLNGGTPPYYFVWSTGEISEDVENLIPGVYRVTINDEHGCSTGNTVQIFQPDAPMTGIITGTDVRCNGGNDGNIYITVAGGHPPYLFEWSNGSVAEDLYGVSAGAYSITVRDVGDCSYVMNITITEPEPITAQAAVNPTICQGQVAQIGLGIPEGGIPPYTIIWGNNTQGMTTLVQPMATTTYSAHIVDAVNCESETFEITVTVNSSYEFVFQDTICEGDSLFWQNNWYSTEGNFQVTYESVLGCDSIYELELELLTLPLQCVIQQVPENGIVGQDNLGQITLQQSEIGTMYYIVSGGIVITDEIEGTNSPLNLGNNLLAGNYEIMSRKLAGGCELLQGTVIFVNGSSTNIITACVGHGNPSLSFAEDEIIISLFKSGVDNNNNATATQVDEKFLETNGQVSFENLEVGTYFLSSVIISPQYTQYYEHIFYPSALIFENATAINIEANTNYIAQLNHSLLNESEGTNQISGTVGTSSSSKTLDPIGGLVVVIENENIAEIFDISVTNTLGEYTFENVPDNTNIRVFVTSLEHQQWQAYRLLTTADQQYNIDFVVNGNSVIPTESQDISQNSVSNFEFNIYPNPVFNKIGLSNVADGSYYKIFDVDGSVVKSGQIINEEIIFSGYSCGTYIIVVKTIYGQIGVQKFIVE